MSIHSPYKLDLTGLGPVARFRAGLLEHRIAARNKRALATLKAMPDLWEELLAYREISDVTGASYSDLLTLHEEVRRRKPCEILEFGPGFSTIVLAHAVKANTAEGSPPARITSMEESAEWHQTALNALPERYADVVELLHSPKVDGTYKMFRGVQYETVPERAYDFVFSDGPERHSLVNGDKLFDLDFINIVRTSDTPVYAVVDNHYLTFYVLQKVFGKNLARYSPVHRLMFVGPVTRHDVRHLKHENFVPDLRIFGHTEFKLRMANEK